MAAPHVKTVDPMQTDLIRFAPDGQVTTEVVPGVPLYHVTEAYVRAYIAAYKAQAAEFDSRVIRDYFLASSFRINSSFTSCRRTMTSSRRQSTRESAWTSVPSMSWQKHILAMYCSMNLLVPNPMGTASC